MNFKFIFIIVMSILLIAFLANYQKLVRVYKVMHLFDKSEISDNFRDMDKIFPTNSVPKSTQPLKLQKDLRDFDFVVNTEKNTYTFDEFIAYSNTSGLMILKEDTIIYEDYYNGLKSTDTHISWSVAKSLISAMIGIAVDEGLISSVQDSVGQYLPELKGTSYGSVSIENVLQMSSGIKFDEDYKEFNSDINKVGRIFAFGFPFDNYIAKMERERDQGVFNHYVSMDTQVLGMILKAVTKGQFIDYFYKKLWNPIGANYEAKWITDSKGMEVVFGGFNATLLDYAIFGLLYTNLGKINDKIIVPLNWIQLSWDNSYAHLKSGDNSLSSNPYGYGYQWWIPNSEYNYYAAMGVYNQYIIVDPINKITIVKLSANTAYKNDKHRTHREHFQFFDKIIKNVLQDNF